MQANLFLLALAVITTGCNGFLTNDYYNRKRKYYSYSSLSATGHANPQIIAKTTESFKLSDLYLMEAQIQATLLESDSLQSDNMHKYISALTMDPQTGSYLLEINSNKLTGVAYEQANTDNVVNSVERPSCLNRLDWIGEVIASGSCGRNLLDRLEMIKNNPELLGKINDFTLDYLCMGYMREKDFSTSKTLTCRIAQSIPSRAVLDAKKAKTNLLLIETSDCIYLTKKYILTSKMEQGSDEFNVAKRWSGRPFQYSSAINPTVAEITMSLLGDLSKGNSHMTLLNPTVGSGTFEAFALEKGMYVIGFDINDKCVNGTIKNLQYIFGEDFTNKRIDIRVNDSTRLDIRLEHNCNCAVTNLPWGQNTAIENENDNLKILTYLFNNLSEASYCAIISKYEVDDILQSIGFTIISTASIPQTGFQLPQGKKKSKQRNAGSSNCIISICKSKK
ncbi:hypothetical protein CTEN210_12573 [Chaetoceros tenuissimus]|uniref:Ribosomal RNA large subunit methyltransferase K/L-like methyltransferase domain-containing protein n=1 Tax=Chaetoceros tenuissimus TaxID=426638 RepID=A0AAD3D1F4_9STRA|nr:hypothetical protein CTEN210_12573 [Chaetoceros tenuissimus]